MRASIIACGLALQVFAAHALPVNLVVNGGFEATPVASGSWVNVPSIPGWQVVAGPGTGFEVRNNDNGTAHSGNNFIELDTNGNTTIQQTFSSLSAGQSYDLSFWYAPRIGKSAQTNGISVFWNGQLLQNIALNGGNTTTWSEYQFQVPALSGNNSLRFAATGLSDSYGGALDDVSLVASPLPEPPAACLALLGAGALAWVRRRHARG